MSRSAPVDARGVIRILDTPDTISRDAVVAELALGASASITAAEARHPAGQTRQQVVMPGMTTRHRDAGTGHGDTRRRWARTHPVTSFFVLTFAISWGYWGVVLGALGQDSLPSMIPGAFGPAAAAVILTTRLDGRAGLRDFGRRSLRWRVGLLRWYAAGLVALPTLVVLSYVLLPDGTDRFVEEGWLTVPLFLTTALVIALVGGGQEEPGWRGFALPRLQDRRGPLPAAALLGVVWGLWHPPLFVFIPDYNNSGYGFADVAAMYGLFLSTYTTGLSVVLAWLYNSARASILFLMLTEAARRFAA